MLKKYALILGANNKLGQHLVKEFNKRSIWARWRTLAVDSKKNFEATDSLVVDKDATPREKVDQVFKKAKDFAEEYDAIIITHSEGDFQESRISDFDVFEKYEQLYNQNVYTSLMAAKVAGHLLAPCGFMVFHSSQEAFEQTNPNNFATNLSRMQS